MEFTRLAVKSSIAFLIGLALIGCDQNKSPSAAGAAPPQPMFKLVAYGKRGHSCKVQFMLYNKQPQRIDAISIAVTGKLDYEKKTSRLLVEYVPAGGDSGFFHENFLSDCYRQCKFEVQEIDYCKIGGKAYSNCLDYLEVKSEDPTCSITIVKK